MQHSFKCKLLKQNVAIITKWIFHTFSVISCLNILFCNWKKNNLNLENNFQMTSAWRVILDISEPIYFSRCNMNHKMTCFFFSFFFFNSSIGSVKFLLYLFFLCFLNFDGKLSFEMGRCLCSQKEIKFVHYYCFVFF